MANLGDLPELVRDSQLISMTTDMETEHLRHSAPRILARRERWVLKRQIGRGGYDDVWLQQQVEGTEVGTLRVLKRIQTFTDRRSSSRRFVRELEAVANFSQEKVSALRDLWRLYRQLTIVLPVRRILRQILRLVRYIRLPQHHHGVL